MTIKVTLHHLADAGPKQQAIAAEACRLLEQALNDPRFPEQVRAATYLETRFRDGLGWRSIPVADLPGAVAGGAEMGTQADGEIDLEVDLDWFRSGVLGSTIPGVLPFRTAYWFINDCIKYNEPAELAGHFMHEWLHVCGFYHWPDNGARDDVAYNIGNIVRDLARAKDKGPRLMPDWLNQGSCGASVPDVEGDKADADISQLMQ
jgi:hypothetical protein